MLFYLLIVTLLVIGLAARHVARSNPWFRLLAVTFACWADRSRSGADLGRR